MRQRVNSKYVKSLSTLLQLILPILTNVDHDMAIYVHTTIQYQRTICEHKLGIADQCCLWVYYSWWTMYL